LPESLALARAVRADGVLDHGVQIGGLAHARDQTGVGRDRGGTLANGVGGYGHGGAQAGVHPLDSMLMA